MNEKETLAPRFRAGRWRMLKNASLAARFLMMMIIMAFVIGIASVWVNYSEYSGAVMDNYQENAQLLNEVAGMSVDWADIDKWLASAGEAQAGEDYRDTSDFLHRLMASHNGITYLCIITADTGGMHYVFDAEYGDGHFDLGTYVPWEEDDVPQDVSDAIVRGDYTVRSYTEKEDLPEMGGLHNVVAFTKGFGDNGYGKAKGYLLAGFDLDLVMTAQRSYLVKSGVTIGVFIVIFSIIYSAIAYRNLIKPIKGLSNDVAKFVQDEILSRYSDEAQEKSSSFSASYTKNELVYLENTVTSMQTEMLAYMESLNLANRKASTDSMTGLLNRESFVKFITAYFENRYIIKHACSFIMIDLDYFKSINDNYGHAAGDEAIIKCAEFLRQLFRAEDAMMRMMSGADTDAVARMGGDEFAVFCRNFGNAEVIGLKIQKLLAMLREIHPGGSASGVTASIGIAIIKDEDGFANANYLTLYATADRALYEVKDRGRNGFEIVFV